MFIAAQQCTHWKVALKNLGLIPELVLLLTAATYHCKPHASICHIHNKVTQNCMCLKLVSTSHCLGVHVVQSYVVTELVICS